MVFLAAGAGLGFLVSTALCDTVGRIRGNFAYVKNVEFTQLLIAALGPRSRLAVTICVQGFFIVLQSLYILLIANLIDAFIIIMYERAVAVEWFLHDGRVRMQVVAPPELYADPFIGKVGLDLDHSHTPFVVTIGYVVAGCILVPLSFAVTRVQTIAKLGVAGVIAIAALILLLIHSALGYPHRVRDNFHHTPVLGRLAGMLVDSPILLSLFSVAAFMPSWLHVRVTRPDSYVRVRHVLSFAFGCGLAVVVVCCLLFGALAKPRALDPEVSILLMAPSMRPPVLAASVALCIIPFAVVYPWITTAFTSAVTTGGLISPVYASTAVRLMPWLWCWMGARSSLWYAWATWAGVVFNGLACFVLPMLAFVAVSRRVEQRASPFPADIDTSVAAAADDDSASAHSSTTFGIPRQGLSTEDYAPISPQRSAAMERTPTLASDATDALAGAFGHPRYDGSDPQPSRVVLATVPEVTFLTEKQAAVVSPATVGTVVLIAVVAWMAFCCAGAIIEYW